MSGTSAPPPRQRDSQPLDDRELDAVAEAMRILGHSIRLRLVDMLRARGELSVGELDALTGVGQPALSQQLAILRKAEMVRTRRVAKLVYYSLAPEALRGVARFAALLADPARTGATEPATARQTGSAAMFARIL